MRAVVFVAAFVLLVTLLSRPTEAVLGVDTSQFICDKLGQNDWNCLVQNGKSFAIIQAWCGGYGYGNSVASCVGDAWAAGMAHVDVYAFLCPNCDGNNPCSGAIQQLHSNLANQGVQYGMLWIDVEECDGCWNDAGSNVAFIKECVSTAQSLGINVGMYSSEYEWASVTGGASGFENLPLWYAHYDGVPNFSDAWAYQFGNWGSPAIKQYNDQCDVCGETGNFDVSWYPDSMSDMLAQMRNNTRTIRLDNHGKI